MQKKILEQLIANTDFNALRADPTLQQFQAKPAVGRELLGFDEESKMELVKSRFENIDEYDLVDGEQFFNDLD
jgi:hypothetical protein